MRFSTRLARLESEMQATIIEAHIFEAQNDARSRFRSKKWSLG